MKYEFLFRRILSFPERELFFDRNGSQPFIQRVEKQFGQLVWLARKLPRCCISSGNLSGLFG